VREAGVSSPTPIDANPWTDEQVAAITARRIPAIVTAGAGSGKTRVLVECVVRSIVDDGVDPRRILAVTFTNKAAAEMKNRIRSRLAEALIERDGDAAQLPEHDPVVETIDAWCNRLLAAHSLDVGLDPEFTILARGAETAAFEKRAMDRALGAMLDDPTDRERLLDLLAEVKAIPALLVSAHKTMLTAGVASPALPPVDPEDVESRIEAAAAALSGAAATLKVAIEARIEAGANQTPKVDEALDSCEAARAIDTSVPLPAELLKINLSPNANKGEESKAFNSLLIELRTALEARRMLPHYVAAADLLELYTQASSDLKHEEAVLTFADVEMLAVSLLRDRGEGEAAFDRVFVDEFQDVNPLQREMVELVSGGSSYAVGDAAQAIYGFRGADVSLIEERAERFAGSDGSLSLLSNFRSVAGVLEVNNHVHPRLDVLGFRELNVGNLEPGPDEPVELLVVDCDHPATDGARPNDLEDSLVARRVKSLIDDDGLSAGRIAILARARSALPSIADSLRKLGIPAVIEGGGGLWNRPEVDDVVALLASCGNPNDEESLLKVLHSPMAGVSIDGLVLVARRARSTKQSLWDVLRQTGDLPLSGADREAVSRFVSWFESQRRLVGRRPLVDAIEASMVETGYDLHLLGLIEGERRFANVRALQRFAAEWERTNGRDPRGFADAAAELAAAERNDDDQEAVIEQDGESVGAVRLLTMHGSKGLQFDTVLIPRLGSRHRGDSDRLRVSPDGTRAAIPFKPGDETVGLYDADLIDERDSAEAAERARLLYVAMTRAERKLILTGAAKLRKAKKAEDQTVIGPRGGPSYMAEIHSVMAPGLASVLFSGAGDDDGDGRSGEDDGGQEDEVRWVESVGAGTSVTVTLDRGESLRWFAGETAEPPSGIPLTDPEPRIGALDPPEFAIRPAQFSYSGLQVAARCSWRWYLESVVRMSPPLEAVSAQGGAKQLPARVRGVTMHALLENREFGSDRPIGIDEAILAASLAQEDLDEALAPQAIEAAQRILGSSTWADLEQAAAADPASVRREEGFSLLVDCGPHGEVVLRGVFDVFQRRSDGPLRVIDWKTSNHASGAADLEQLVAVDYGIQRSAYALAALRSAGRPDEVEVVHLYAERADSPVSASWSRSDADRLETELAERISALLDGRVAPTDQPSEGVCAGCPAKGTICPRWPYESAFDAAG